MLFGFAVGFTSRVPQSEWHPLWACALWNSLEVSSWWVVSLLTPPTLLFLTVVWLQERTFSGSSILTQPICDFHVKGVLVFAGRRLTDLSVFKSILKEWCLCLWSLYLKNTQAKCESVRPEWLMTHTDTFTAVHGRLNECYDRLHHIVCSFAASGGLKGVGWGHAAI